MTAEGGIRMQIKREAISREMIETALTCETPTELVKLAKERGYEMTEAEAEAYLSELADFQLDSDQLKKVAGGLYESHDSKVTCRQYCNGDCYQVCYEYY